MKATVALASLASLAVAAGLSGCASVHNPDPLEALNRRTFAVNDAVDKAVIQPVARAYVEHLPMSVRTGVGNLLANPRDLWSAVNLFLQGRPADGMSDVMRVGTNTLFGVAGWFDVATGMGMVRHGEDLGQTLGRWGLAPGAYLVLPLLGPSSVRDAFGTVADLALAPQNFVGDPALRNSLTLLQLTDDRARLLPTTALVSDIALDRYLFVRDAYLQRRRSLVHDGDPPDDMTATRLDRDPPDPVNPPKAPR